MAAETRPRRSYHHGDLRAALIEVALDLIAERGVYGFSLAEAARRIGVSSSAPYKHFTDRGELLAAASARAWQELLARSAEPFEQAAGPIDKLATVSVEFVRFAAERREMYDVLFPAAIDKLRYPELAATGATVTEILMGPARQLVPRGRDDLAKALVEAVGALARGYADLALDGTWGPAIESVGVATKRADAATRALIRGRNLLFATVR